VHLLLVWLKGILCEMDSLFSKTTFSPSFKVDDDELEDGLYRINDST
jgi:hypothetical protein